MNNEVRLIGNVGSDPETKVFDNGGKIGVISLATTDTWTSKDGQKQSKTSWHRLQLHEKLLKVMSYIKKGSMIAVSGSIDYQNHEDKWYTSIRVKQVMLLEKKKNTQDGPQSQSADKQIKNVVEEEQEDDLPF